MSKLITRTAFVEKLQRRRCKCVSTCSSIFGGITEKTEIYRRKQETCEYWVTERFCHRLVVNETSAIWDGFTIDFQPEEGGEV